jgi:hypothetical protein
MQRPLSYKIVHEPLDNLYRVELYMPGHGVLYFTHAEFPLFVYLVNKASTDLKWRTRTKTAKQLINTAP